MSEKISIDKGVIYAIEDATNSVFIDQKNLGHLFDFLGKLGIDSDECDLILKGNPPGIKRLTRALENTHFIWTYDKQKYLKEGQSNNDNRNNR